MADVRSKAEMDGQADRAFLRADLGAVESMLATLHPSRVAERIGLEDKRRSLREAIAQFRETPDDTLTPVSSGDDLP